MTFRFSSSSTTRWFAPCPTCKGVSETQMCAGDRLLFCADCTEWYIL